MKELKYVRFEEGLAVFPNFLAHKDIAKTSFLMPISAGFVKIENGEVNCYGKSISLKLESREKDKELLSLFLGLNKTTPKNP